MASNVHLRPVDPLQNEQYRFKKTIAQEIWGDPGTEQAGESLFQLLESYLDRCDQERRIVSQRSSSAGNRLDVELLRAIGAVKAEPDALKAALSAKLGHDTRDLCLDMAVRLMHSTFVRFADTSIISGTIFQPRWRDAESLVSFLTRVYPQSQSPAALGQENGRVQMSKFSASYLARFTGVSIEWTHHLNDHLMLLRGSTWKTLYLFQHPAFLKVSLDILSRDRMDSTHSISEALRLGCLPPRLLRETLMTFNLLFPELGEEASRAMLVSDCSKHGLDPYFLTRDEHYYNEHENPTDALDPTDVRGLYEKYPYWGYRLYELWKEADDPTPITRIERWTESRRNPRFTYWCTAVSLAIAVSFGVAATILGGLQFWTSYCSWRGCGEPSPGAEKR